MTYRQIRAIVTDEVSVIVKRHTQRPIYKLDWIRGHDDMGVLAGLPYAIMCERLGALLIQEE